MGNNSFWSAIENDKSYQINVLRYEYWIKNLKDDVRVIIRTWSTTCQDDNL